MASKRLSSNQWDFFHYLVSGRTIPGYLRGRTEESLLKRRLITKTTQKHPTGTGRFGDPFREITVTVFGFTPEGLAIYESNRTRIYEEKAQALKNEFEADLNRARAR